MTSFRSDSNRLAEADRVVLLAAAQRLRADLKVAWEKHRGAILPGDLDAESVFGEAYSQAGDVVEELGGRPS